MSHTINIKKRSGEFNPLDITKIRKMTNEAVNCLDGVSQSELELDAQIKFVDGMSSSDIQDALIKTAVEKIDIDVPNWTFVGARLFLFDLYHKVGRVVGGTKGNSYCDLKTYFNHAIALNRITPTFIFTKDNEGTIFELFDLDELSEYIKPERDLQFNYLGIKTLYDKYLIKDHQGNPIELPQHMFMAIAMFLAQDEETKELKMLRAKEFYDAISQFEVMLATPTLSGARKNRNQLASCYIGASGDNIEGIFDAYKEMALLSKHGGGIGWDWHDIRGMGGTIDNNHAAAGGTVPFLKINNDLALAVDQLGVRKGSIAVYIEPWHIDIEDFIDLKKNSGEDRRRAHDLFPALWIPDLFMQRVSEDANWTLFDPYETKDLHNLTEDEFDKKYIEYEHNPNIRKVEIKAKDLWKKILTSYFESGSPFLCWKDSANRANPNKHIGKIRSSNLCTEIFQNTSPDTYMLKLYNAFIDHSTGEVSSSDESYILVTEETIALLDNGFQKEAKYLNSIDTILAFKENGSDDKYFEFLDEPFKIYNIEKQRIPGKTAVCNLASINLSKIKTKEDIERVVPIAVRMLDKVIDLNFYPLKKVKDTNLASRAIGLGAMGEAQMLAEDGIMYGSQEHLNRINYIFECISYNTIKASSALGREKGNYPDFEGSNWSKGIMPHDHANHNVLELTTENTSVYSQSEWDVLRDVATKNMRNGYLMAIAPTSSISILVGTTQSTEAVYKRKWFEENMSGLIPVTVPNLNPDTWAYYIPAFEVNQLDTIKAAAIRQKWIDQGQSTNIFMSLDKASGKYLNNIYMLAWKLGLKSTYYLRSQSADSKKAEMGKATNEISEGTDIVNNTNSPDVIDRSIECDSCQ